MNLLFLTLTGVVKRTLANVSYPKIHSKCNEMTYSYDVQDELGDETLSCGSGAPEQNLCAWLARGDVRILAL